MGRTPANHGLDKLPANEPVRLVKGDDGTLTIRRERDDASWNGTGFVVDAPPLNRYAVTVIVQAVDDPTARQLVADALTAAKADAEVGPLAVLIAEGVD